jgi:leucyl-tRNA synthetase
LIDYKAVEEKWQKAWRDAKIFEPGVSDRQPYMVTAAFPYTNGPQHIGHLRTYATADVLARYKRMKGFNVLYPMGFHLTGIPIISQANKLKEGDPGVIKDFKSFGIPENEIEKMKDPLYMGNYFANSAKNSMMLAGYSIDWTRSLNSIEPSFSKMVEWQFGLLNKKGHLVQGRHPVGWCPKDGGAVGMHDTKGDVEPEIEKETAVKFKVVGEEYSILCVTFRPETIQGVTNLFINETAVYAICRSGPDTYCISLQSMDSLKYQIELVKIAELKGSELLSKRCINPFNGSSIPIYPGYFVKEDIGTGAVMSVPAHAPFDYVAIERLKSSGYPIGELKPIVVVSMPKPDAKPSGNVASDVPELELPALKYLRAVNAGINSPDEDIEKATKLEYKEESYKGIMAVKGYEGMPEQEARDRIAESLIKSSAAIEVYALVNDKPVFCRCMTRVVVKVVDNQWFINYGNEEWKSAVREHLSKMNIFPEKSRSAFESAIEWINLRAVVRAQGLGTRFPIDPTHIIESLSDSTIYMAFYTIRNLIRGVDPEKLKPEFFDYVYLGEGNPQAVSDSTSIDYDIIKKCRESFTYWYCDTSRHSALELIFNHLSMYLFNHVAIFKKENWPKQIVVNGMVLMEGEKMSKSLGNIITLDNGFKKFGVDPARLVVVASTDLFNDSNFMEDSVNGVKERFEYINDVCLQLEKLETGELRQTDYWLYSRLNRKIDVISKAMEELELRAVSTELLYNTAKELRRYFARGGKNSVVVRDYVSSITLMLQPIAPHISEELWHILGNDSFSSAERWPVADASMINGKIEDQELLVDNVIEDAKQASALMSKKFGKKPKLMRIIVANQWKSDMLNSFAKSKNIGESVKAVVAAGADVAQAQRFAEGLAKKANEVHEMRLSENDEFESLSGATEYIAAMLGCNISIEQESQSKSQRAQRASPMKPSIDIET